MAAGRIESLAVCIIVKTVLNSCYALKKMNNIILYFFPSNAFTSDLWQYWFKSWNRDKSPQQFQDFSRCGFIAVQVKAIEVTSFRICWNFFFFVSIVKFFS